LSADLRAWQKHGIIELIHYPYDPGSRARAITPSAIPSDAQWRDMNGTWEEDETGTWDDFHGSPHLPES